MKLSTTLVTLATQSLLAGAHGVRDKGKPHEQACAFTITSTGPFNCPAGRLEDGQIRLNGSYPTTEFTIVNGGIMDSAGFGCIVTEPPTTQFQCDMNKAPDANFAFGPGSSSNNLLTYKGSPQFYACPATDTEWNVYVQPDFGQAKCVPIQLTASGCGGQVAECTPLPPVTIWQTQIVTEAVTALSTVTVTTTVEDSGGGGGGGGGGCGLPPPPPPTTLATSATGCRECTGSGNWTGGETMPPM